MSLQPILSNQGEKNLLIMNKGNIYTQNVNIDRKLIRVNRLCDEQKRLLTINIPGPRPESLSSFPDTQKLKDKTNLC